MNASLALSTLLLVGCWSAPLRAADPVQAAGNRAAASLFPNPSGAFVIPGGDSGGDEGSLQWLLESFGMATGVHFVDSKDVSQMLQVVRANRGRPIEVGPTEAWQVVETLLFENGFWIAPLVEAEPRIFGVYSSQQQLPGGGITRARHVPAAELDAWARHPAILVTTVIDLPNSDVRTMSNSMRSMFTDVNTQQLIPVGNSNSLILTGFGANVAAIARMLRAVDEASKASSTTARPAPAPAPAAQPEAAKNPR